MDDKRPASESWIKKERDCERWQSLALFGSNLFNSLHPPLTAHAQWSANTQVSLLPPPCEELTTNDPLVIATRVNPPGTTSISRP